MTSAHSTSSSPADHIIESRRGFISAMQSMHDQEVNQELEKCMTQVEPIQAQQQASSPSAHAGDAKLVLEEEATDRYLDAIREALQGTEDREIAVAVSEKVVALTLAELAAQGESLSGSVNRSSNTCGTAQNEASSDLPPAALQAMLQHKGPVMMDFDPLLKQTTSTLPPQLQQLKFKLVIEATKIARARAASPTSTDPKDAQKHINETLRAHGELDFPFDELTVAHDPTSPTGMSVKLEPDLAAVLSNLSKRRPQLSLLLRDLLSVYVEKADKAGVQFKHSPTNPPQANFKPTAPRRTLSVQTSQILMQVYEEVVKHPDVVPKSTAYVLPIHQLLHAPTESLPLKLQQLKRHLLETFKKLGKQSGAAGPDYDKLVINHVLRAHGEADFDFDDLFQYEARESPTGTAVQFGKKAMAHLADLADRKRPLYNLVLDMIQEYVTRGSQAQGYFRTSRRGVSDARS